MRQIHRCNINRYDIPAHGMPPLFMCAWMCVRDLCSTLSQKTSGSPDRANWSSLKITSAIKNFSAFGYRTVLTQPMTNTVASNMENTFCYLPLLLFNSFKIVHEVMWGFINSRADSPSSPTFKQQEDRIRALGCWKVIIIWDLPLHCVRKVRNIMHCNARYYVREQFEAIGTNAGKLSEEYKKRGQGISWWQ